MNWLPNFLNPWPAIFAGVVAAGLLLILYFLKLRRREMPISSTLLWKKAVQDLQVNAPFQRLRRNLLLLLQMLLIALLALALARPIVNYTPGAGKMAVILIDRSASMSAGDQNGHSRLDEAKKQARQLVSSLERNAIAMVIAFDDSAETVQSFTPDAATLRTAIDSIQPTDRRTKIKLAYQLAEAQSNFNPEQLRSNIRPEVWLYSDGRVLDGTDLSLRGELKYVKIGSDDAPNIAIVALSAKRNYERPTEVQVFARLANFGPDVVSADVQMSVDGQVRSIATTTLFPERWTTLQRETAARDKGVIGRDSVEFKIDLTSSAVIKVEQMNKEADVLAVDDAAHVVVPPPKALQVLLVTENNYFLERAINSLGLKNPDHLSPAAYEQKTPSGYDVIIFDRYVPQRLPNSGNFLYFGAVPEGIKLKPVLQDGHRVMLTDMGVLDWKRDHPMLRHLALNKLYIAQAIKLDVPLESEILVDGLKGPLIVLHREGRNTHLVVAFDLLESNWPLKVSFPVFLENAVQFLAMGAEMNLRQSYDPGTTPRIARTYFQKLGSSQKSIRLSGPGISRDVAVPETGDFALPSLDKVGIYRLNPPIPQFEQIAVNLLDASESNLATVSEPPGGIGATLDGQHTKARRELWWWIIVCAALPLLFIEWWVYTRRLHL